MEFHFIIILKTKGNWLIQNIRFIQKETLRKPKVWKLIASENYVSDEVLKAMGSVLTNKYAKDIRANVITVDVK